MTYQAELAYLLARQYINGTDALGFILGDGTLDDNGLKMYSVRGMLERQNGVRKLSGDFLKCILNNFIMLLLYFIWG